MVVGFRTRRRILGTMGDGFVDLMVSNYVDFKLNDLPGFGKAATCKYRALRCSQLVTLGSWVLKNSLFHKRSRREFQQYALNIAGVNDPVWMLWASA